MNRKIEKLVKGFPTKDGAGVSLVRVLGHDTVKDFDPFLMLDSFDSLNPKDYVAGFPMHPHRGIITISYLSQGAMMHRDSLGNSDTITDGQVQWMTAGSGIMHEELLPASPRMLGVQLWLNMPKSAKMTPPAYKSIKEDEIKEIPLEGGILRILCGEYEGQKAYMSAHVPLNYYAIRLEPNAHVTVSTRPNDCVLVFTLLGGVKLCGVEIEEKTAVKLEPATSLTLETQGSAEVLVMSAEALREPVAWGGPIVMNTQDELRLAFSELQRGSFLKEALKY